MESSAKISLPDSSVASVSPSNTEVHLSSLSNGNGNGNGNGLALAQESTCRARAVGSEVEVEEVRRSLRGPISASRGALRVSTSLLLTMVYVMIVLIWVCHFSLILKSCKDDCDNDDDDDGISDYDCDCAPRKHIE